MTARLFRGTTLVATVVLLGLLVPVNVFERVPLAVHAAAMGFGVFNVVLYRRAVAGRYHYVAFFAGLLVTLDVAWIGSGGSDGSANMWLVTGVITAVLFFQGNALRAALAAFCANGMALYGLERVVPDVVIPFRSPEVRLYDMVTGFVLASSTAATLVWVVLNAYRRERRRLAEAVTELERRTQEVHTLRGLLPICAWCKKVRTDSGLWTEAARYLESHPDVRITHGLCPSCLEAQLAAPDEYR
ncbi:MAG: hypothetical protein U0610_18775 [bacterium]